MDSQHQSRGAVAASLASIASLIAALSCCLPLGTLLMAAGSAGASLFAERLRPWLLLLSVASLIFAFVQTYFRNRCDFRYRKLRTILLWMSICVVTAMLALPRQVSSLLAGQAPWQAVAGTLHEFNQVSFVRDFNAAQRQTRVIVLLSPT